MRRVLAAGALALALAVSACGGGSADLDLSAGDPLAGRAAYGTHCAACHGAQGEGAVSGPPLVGPEARDLTAQQVVAAVREGVATDQWAGSPMPALPGVSDEELVDIVAYLRQLWEESGEVPADPSSP